MGRGSLKLTALSGSWVNTVSPQKGGFLNVLQTYHRVICPWKGYAWYGNVMPNGLRSAGLSARLH